MPDAVLSPTLLVATVVLDRRGRALLTRHAPYRKWHFPDADAVFGERLHVTAARAFKEDLGAEAMVNCEPYAASETLGSDGRVHLVTVHFRATAPLKQLVPRDGVEWRLFGRDELAGEPTLHSTIDVLRSKLDWHL